MQYVELGIDHRGVSVPRSTGGQLTSGVYVERVRTDAYWGSVCSGSQPLGFKNRPWSSPRRKIGWCHHLRSNCIRDRGADHVGNLLAVWYHWQISTLDIVWADETDVKFSRSSYLFILTFSSASDSLPVWAVICNKPIESQLFKWQHSCLWQ